MRSFLDLPAGTSFPLQNLPYGVFTRPEGGSPRVGVRVGDLVLDLRLLEEQGLLDLPELDGRRAFVDTALNAFMAMGRPAWGAVRRRLQDLLRADGGPALREHGQLRDAVLLPLAEVTVHLPARIGDYTDFYASRQHATNVGIMFRGRENALMPNWLHLPVGYHGRASSVVVSGTPIVRPQGQTRPKDDEPPVFGPSRQLDIELELGAFVGPGNAMGTPIPIGHAGEHLFGCVLVNDWSARDIQRWEYVPLGPFLAKNFATTLSPWMVTMEALKPYRCPHERAPGDAPPLPYLDDPQDRALGAFDIQLEVWLQPAKAAAPERLSATSFRHQYWTPGQMLAHHTVNGCNLQP
ncbi:MAG TPA: fumarylacetoacetase, partial [Rubricoccaceae bacterium]|nr:fumarylacetoacetase [Rubricoccaceae bacterium]